MEADNAKDRSPAGDGSLVEADLLPSVDPASNSLFAIRKDFIFLLGFVILIFIAYNSPLKQYIDKAPEVCAKIKGTGILAPLIFMLGVALLVTVGVPRLLLCPIGGMAFGFVQGLIYCVTGTLIGYYVIFLFIRWGGRDFVLRHWPRMEKLTKLIGKGGVPGVIIVRQMPLHGMVINLLLGLSTVRHRDFLIGSFIGMFPQAIPFTLIGKGAKQGTLGQSMVYMTLAAIALSLIWLVAKFYSRRKKASIAAAGAGGEAK